MVILTVGVLAAQSAEPGQAKPGELPAHDKPAEAASQQAGETSSAGNAEQGRVVFEGKGGCLSCHRVGGRGSRLGPDLSDIGLQRSSPGELERSILEPDAEILPRNRFYRIVTRDGDTITGRLLNHDTFSVQLIDPKEQLLAFQKSTLREHGFVKDSPMPSYQDKLTPQELTDVITYLASLKGISR
jgi:putative heme-binding domain-containing protein